MPRKAPIDASHQLASINFPKDLVDYLDNMSSELNISRSYLVCIVLEEFRKSGKKIHLEIRVD